MIKTGPYTGAPPSKKAESDYSELITEMKRLWEREGLEASTKAAVNTVATPVPAATVAVPEPVVVTLQGGLREIPSTEVDWFPAEGTEIARCVRRFRDVSDYSLDLLMGGKSNEVTDEPIWGMLKDTQVDARQIKEFLADKSRETSVHGAFSISVKSLKTGICREYISTTWWKNEFDVSYMGFEFLAREVFAHKACSNYSYIVIQLAESS